MKQQRRVNEHESENEAGNEAENGSENTMQTEGVLGDRNTYIMALGEPLPETLTRDEYGVPTHPFWRYFYYKRLLNPRSLSFRLKLFSNRGIWDNPKPPGQDYDYFFTISDYYWKFGVDLRRYLTNTSKKRFNIPLPSPKVVPRDENGLPLNNYWLFKALFREKNPNYLIPLYDEKGVPLDRDEWHKYMEICQDEEWIEINSWSYPEPPEKFDREAFLENYRLGKPYYHPVERIRREIRDLMDPRPEFLQTELKSYQWFCRVKAPHFVPLYTPTVADLAVAYVTVKKNPAAALDDTRFPHGFLPEHRRWLIAAANPSTIQYLQLHAGPGDEVLAEILLRFQKSTKKGFSIV